MDRFWKKTRPDPKTGCIEWMAAKNTNGYGWFSFEGRAHLAHRVAYFLAHDEWAEPLTLHRCHNPSCVNVEHLYEGTPADNGADTSDNGVMQEAVLRSKRDPDYTPLYTPWDTTCDWCGAAITRTHRHKVNEMPTFCDSSCSARNRWHG